MRVPVVEGFIMWTDVGSASTCCSLVLALTQLAQSVPKRSLRKEEFRLRYMARTKSFRKPSAFKSFAASFGRLTQ